MNGVIVGCGAIAPIHAAALKSIDGAALYGACDTDRARADAFAEKYGCRAFYDINDVLNDESVDVVHVCTPHYLHYEMAAAALKSVGLEGRMNNFPAQLSGGEQQRVSIARALAKNPKILLCDEPTGALDYNTGKAILKLLHDTCRSTGTTVIIITHNQAICSMADRVIKIKNGKVTENTVNAEPLPAERIEW